MLNQKCEYNIARISSPSFHFSPSSGIDLTQSPCTSSSLKEVIVQKFGPRLMGQSLAAYRREVEPWFPIISLPRFQDQLMQASEELPLEVLVLCISITLLTTPPPPFLENDSGLGEFKSLYFQVKGLISSTEALGLNSFHILQSRILVTLYEVAHGLYPAAYMSLGAAISAADAFTCHPGMELQFPNITDNEIKREERVFIWCGILVLDRYALLSLDLYLASNRFKIILDANFVLGTWRPSWALIHPKLVQELCCSMISSSHPCVQPTSTKIEKILSYH